MAKERLARKGSRKRPSRVKPSDGETEQRILDAARVVFIRSGTAGARMQEIADEANVNPALLHYYFRSKERLSAAVFHQIASRVFPTLIQTLGAEISVEEKVDRLVALYLDNLSRSPFLPGYLISEMHHHPERLSEMLGMVSGGAPGEVVPPLIAKLGRQIDELASNGKMKRIAPEDFAINLISLCIFPFAARPILTMMFGMDDDAFARFIERRRIELPKYVMSAVRP